MSEPKVTIDAERVWQRLMDFAKIGGTAKGGVHRLALDDLDIEAHGVLAGLATKRGFAVSLDEIGNMIIRREGTDPSLPPVVSGSHTDTQPTGGRFDGILGVLAAFEALEAIDDAGIETRHPLVCVAWNNEEGARFHPGVMGSGVYTGVHDLGKMLATVAPDGDRMGERVEMLHKALPDAGRHSLGQPMAAFVELHIEQGPILEASGNPIGVVGTMQGNRRYYVDVIGEEAHSGTTPRARRKDAFVAAVDIALALRKHFHDEEDVLRFTIGRFEVSPGAMTVVPGHVRFWVDFRHPEQEVLDRLGDGVEDVVRGAAGPCEVKVENPARAAPVVFPDSMIEAIERSASARGLGFERIASGAGHDARHMVRVADTAGMVFIPCWKGISHNEAESAEPEDVAAGTQVIADVMLDFALR